jgi:hypothetical protein
MNKNMGTIPDVSAGSVPNANLEYRIRARETGRRMNEIQKRQVCLDSLNLILEADKLPIPPQNSQEARRSP